VHTIIVGAGIVGAAIADQLAIRGGRVTVLEQSVAASQASSKSFGWINASFAETDAYYRLRKSAVERFRTLCTELDLAHAVRWEGCLWWEDEGDAFTEQYHSMQARNYPCEIINAETFNRLESKIEGAPDACIRTDLEGAANPALVAQALLNRATAHGAQLLTGFEVTDISINASGKLTVQTNHDTFSPDRLVVAAGAQSENLLAMADIRLAMDNKPGVIAVTTPIEPSLNHIIMSPDVHFHQGPDGRLVMGEIFSGALT